jgi:hypothetical protein
MDSTTAKNLIAKGYVAVVYVAYDYANRKSGDIISKHKTYDAALRKARGSSFWGVRLLCDYCDY